MDHFADRLRQCCQEKETCLCVGIDPIYERLPPEVRRGGDEQCQVAAVTTFVRGILDAVAPHVPCVKFQSAHFERYHSLGVQAFHELLHRAREQGLIVIADVKRGDVASTAAQYASAYLDERTDLLGCDAITINPWCGSDGIMPFVERAAATGKGLFAWVRASNPSSDQVQGLRLADGRTVAEALAQTVAQIGAEYVGDCGYSLLGAVVGATKSQEAADLRRLMPRQLLLAPGVGAQGGKASDLKSFFDADGFGAVIAASRSILYAYETAGGDWAQAAQQAAVQLKQQIGDLFAGEARPV